MVSQARSQCKTMLVNKALVLSVRRHHARVTHQIMLLVLSSAGARGAKGSNEPSLGVCVFHQQANQRAHPIVFYDNAFAQTQNFNFDSKRPF